MPQPTRCVARTTPYAWPFDGDLDPARTAMVVVAPRRVSETCRRPAAGDRAEAQVATLAQRVRDAGGVVVLVTTTPPPRAGACWLAVEPPAVTVDVTVAAQGVDGFYGSSLDAVLRSRSRDRLLVCGTWLETGVHSTLRSANDRGYECLLVLDACTPYDETLVAPARSQIEMSGGIFGAAGATADVLTALSPADAADAAHPDHPDHFTERTPA